MTLSDAIRLANRRGLATADFNLPDHARYRAMPQFVRDVRFVIGNPYWSQKRGWFHFVPDRTSYDLPLDFGRMLALRPYWNNQCCHPMQYVGEDPSKVLANSSPNGTPYCGYQHPYRGGWYVEHTQNNYSLGPIGLANYGYVSAVSSEWPPLTATTVSMGQQTLVFASYSSSSALTPYSYSTGFLRFDTSTLPIEATITGATLSLYIDTPILNTDSKILLIQWYNEWPIDEEDYTPAPFDGARIATVSSLGQGLNEMELLDATQINRYGFSGLRLQLGPEQPTGANEVKFNVKSGGPFAEEFAEEFDKGQIPIGATMQIRYTVPIVYPFQLRLTGPVDSAFDAEGLYDWVIPTSIMDPELDQYMPPNIQGLFVDKLECDILKDAFGQGDGRYVSAREEYDRALETLLPMSEAAPKRKAIYVR